MLFVIVKLFHIFFAILAVGSTVLFGMWLSLAVKDKTSLPFALKSIGTLSRRVTTPSYLMMLVTGALMLYTGRLPLSQSWLIVALVLYASAVLISMLIQAPTLRQQIHLIETEGPTSAGFIALAKRGKNTATALEVIVFLILILMVIKPTFWG